MTTNTNAAQAGAESYQLPSLDDLLRIARQCAAATDEMHGYLPITSDALETWKPHRWVIDAMKQTIVESVAMRAQAAPAAVAGPMRDEIQRLAQFADTATRMMNPRDVRNNMETLAEELTRMLAATPVAPSDTFQQRVQPWMMACFGPAISADVAERNHRFLEEALELVQACGCSISEAHQLVDYVFGRPVGDKLQEVGGVMVTLAALCLAQGLDMHSAGDIELARIWTKVDAIRAKQAAKPKHSPLPMAAPAAVAGPSLHFDFKQATEMLQMFGGQPGEVVVMTGHGHSGYGMYAAWVADMEGSIYLGETDDDAEPAPTAPAAQGDALDTERLDFISKYRVALIPEFEGGWEAQVYEEDGEPRVIAGGDSVHSAIDAARAAKGVE